MALIQCTECGHDVSTRAHACPNCGCPVELILQDLAEKAAANAANDEVLELLDIPSPDRVLLHCRVCDADCEIDSTAFKSVGPGCCELAQDLPCPSCGAVHSTGKLIFKKGIPSGSSAAVVSCPHCGSTDYDVVNAGPSIGAALVGDMLLGPVGAAIGAASSQGIKSGHQAYLPQVRKHNRTPEQDLCGRLAILRGDIPHDRFDKHLVRLPLSQRRIGHMRDAVFFFPRVICLPLTIKMCLDLIDSRLDLIVGDQVHEPVRLKVRYADGADRSRAIERFQFPPRAVIIRERPVQQHEVEIVRSQQPHRLFHRFSCVIVGLEIDLRNKKQFLAVNAAASDAIAHRFYVSIVVHDGSRRQDVPA